MEFCSQLLFPFLQLHHSFLIPAASLAAQVTGPTRDHSCLGKQRPIQSYSLQEAQTHYSHRTCTFTMKNGCRVSMWWTITLLRSRLSKATLFASLTLSHTKVLPQTKCTAFLSWFAPTAALICTTSTNILAEGNVLKRSLRGLTWGHKI